jgi:SAM-dependent methyltransferase
VPERRRHLVLDWLMLNGGIRYYPVLAILRRMNAASVLDVGCGDGGLGMFDPNRRFVGCDLRFVASRPPMVPVVGRGGALPFRDGAFDAVISLDTLEHVPVAERPAFIADLARVGRRRLVLAMPCGPAARLAERLLDRWYALLGISTPAWLAEHVQEGLPDRAAVEAAVAALGRPYRVYGNENVLAHLLVMMAESTELLRPRLARLAGERVDRMARMMAWLNMAWLNMRPTYRLLFEIDLDGPVERATTL